jgi:hypothetical protein
MILHAGLIALRLGGRWAGVLIEGPSGSGKSDLALRALEDGFRLVADDRVVVWASGGVAYGRAPAALVGLIEVRGQGVRRVAPVDFARVVLVAVCGASPDAIERMPDLAYADVAGVATPRLAVSAFEASAPTKLRHAMQHLGVARQQAYQPPPLGGSGRAGTGDTP